MKMRWLVSIFAVLVSLNAFAADVNVTWENPTTYVDDTPLLPEDIKHTYIEWGVCVNDQFPPTASGNGLAGGALQAFSVTGLAANKQWCFRAKTVDVSDQESDWSNTSSVFLIRKPRPPRVLFPPANATNVVIQ